jgi:hypothetical protein
MVLNRMYDRRDDTASIPALFGFLDQSEIVERLQRNARNAYSNLGVAGEPSEEITNMLEGWSTEPTAPTYG